MSASNIGQRIKEKRKQQQLSRADLAQFIGTSIEGLRKIEQGITTSPRISTLQNLASKLGTSVEYLLRGEFIKQEQIENPAELKLDQTDDSTLLIMLPWPIQLDIESKKHLIRRLSVEFDIIRERQYS